MFYYCYRFNDLICITWKPRHRLWRADMIFYLKFFLFIISNGESVQEIPKKGKFMSRLLILLLLRCRFDRRWLLLVFALNACLPAGACRNLNFLKTWLMRGHAEDCYTAKVAHMYARMLRIQRKAFSLLLCTI